MPNGIKPRAATNAYVRCTMDDKLHQEEHLHTSVSTSRLETRFSTLGFRGALENVRLELCDAILDSNMSATTPSLRHQVIRVYKGTTQKLQQTDIDVDVDNSQNCCTCRETTRRAMTGPDHDCTRRFLVSNT